MKKALIGAYLLCALVYFASMSHRITADPTQQQSTHKIQSLMLAGESLLFPFYLAYFYLQGMNPSDRPVQPAITPSSSLDQDNRGGNRERSPI
jgi:hypothetical protein